MQPNFVVRLLFLLRFRSGKDSGFLGSRACVIVPASPALRTQRSPCRAAADL